MGAPQRIRVPADKARSIIATKVSDPHVPLERHVFQSHDLPWSFGSYVDGLLHPEHVKCTAAAHETFTPLAPIAVVR